MKIENVKFYYESKSKNKKIIMSMIIKRDTYYTLHVYNYLFTFSYLFIYIVSYLFHIPNLPHVPKKKKKIKPRTSTLHAYTILFKSKHHKDSYTHTSLKYTMETYIIQLVKKAKTFHPRPTFFPSADIHPTLISFFKNNKVQASFRRARERERELPSLREFIVSVRLGSAYLARYRRDTRSKWTKEELQERSYPLEEAGSLVVVPCDNRLSICGCLEREPNNLTSARHAPATKPIR